MQPVGLDFRIERFWAWFERHAAALLHLDKADSSLWSECQTRLRRVDAGLDFEFSGKDENGARDFVITACGDRALFSTADRTVERAPTITAWRIRSLKPALGDDFELSVGDLVLSSRTLWFIPLEEAHDHEAFGIRIGVPGLQDESGAVTAAASFVLMTLLGERAFGDQIQYLEAAPLPSDPRSQGFFEITKLANYIELRGKGTAPSE